MESGSAIATFILNNTLLVILPGSYQSAVVETWKLIVFLCHFLCPPPDRSTTKPRTFDPVWNESFIHEVENANVLGMTIFHEGPITDVFVANTTIAFDDLVTRNESEQQDFWVRKHTQKTTVSIQLY